jgi:hypothetical protein
MGLLRMRNMSKRTNLCRPFEELPGLARSVILSPDGKHVAFLPRMDAELDERHLKAMVASPPASHSRLMVSVHCIRLLLRV